MDGGLSTGIRQLSIRINIHQHSLELKTATIHDELGRELQNTVSQVYPQQYRHSMSELSLKHGTHSLATASDEPSFLKNLRQRRARSSLFDLLRRSPICLEWYTCTRSSKSPSGT